MVGARFCEECAAPLARTCGNCGCQLSPTARFCPECAHATGLTPDAPAAPRFASHTPKHRAEGILNSKAALDGERKQVTVLFADLKGSMELLADRDPEDARRILDPVLERMMDAVHRYDGTVNQVMGDGIMALFGAPLAHEDHAVRACYAALRMQESVRQHAVQMGRTTAVPLAIRVGLNSGEVVVRSIGSDLRMDYTAVGQTTHLAARMEQAAQPGSVVLTLGTLRLAEGFIEVRSLGEMPVKGLADPMELYELTGNGPARTRFQAAAARGLTRFVGRDPEVEQLGRSLDRAGAGKGQVVAILGEAGVGKSRLFHEFIHARRMRGWLILESGSVSYGKATAYLPVIQLLKGYFKIQDRDDHQEIRDKVIGRVLGLDRSLEPLLPPFLALLDVPMEDSEWAALDPSQRRQRTLDAVKRLLLRESQVQPLLLVIEDLHWIDGETQTLLDNLVNGLGAIRMLLLVNYRPEYEDRWGKKTYYTQLRLGSLPPESTGELLRALVGDDPGLEPLKQVLGRRGNPFFLEETVRTLVETKALEGLRGAYGLVRPVQSLQIPATVQAILAARIDRLPAEDKQLLQTASVIGKDVPFAILTTIADLPAEALRQGLGRLQEAEFLYETTLFPDLEYTFKHALTHDVAYGSLLQERRRALHGQIVEIIERLYPDRLAEHVERLAHHALRGEQWEKAVRYSRQAGVKSLERWANREATGHFEQALSVLARLPEARSTRELAVDVRLDVYYAMQPLNELPRLLEHLRAAEALARELGDESRLAWTLLHVSHLLVLIGECAEGVDVGQAALAIGQSTGDRVLQVVALLWVGCGCYALGQHRRAVDLLGQSLAVLAETPQGEGDVASRFLRTRMPVETRAYRSMFLSELGRFVEADTAGREAIRIAEALDHPYSRALVPWMVGTGLSVKGDVNRAVSLFERGMAEAAKWGYARTGGFNSCALGYALATAGRAVEGVGLLRRGVEQIDATLGFTWLRGRRLSMLGEGYLLAGQIDDSRVAAEEALTFSRKRRERGFEAWAVRLLGMIAACSDPPDAGTSEVHYRAALALANELEMRPLVAHCHLGLGKLYCHTQDKVNAQEHLTTATTMYREMGMRFWLDQAETAMRERA